eukprot:scaffold11917_cov128-Isochrysis_galbana.AAC.8
MNTLVTGAKAQSLAALNVRRPPHACPLSVLAGGVGLVAHRVLGPRAATGASRQHLPSVGTRQHMRAQGN